MLNIPSCAYCVQIATTFLLSATDALVVPSSRIFALMNSTARYAPVVTAWIDAPVNQSIIAPPVIRPSRHGGRRIEMVDSSAGASPRGSGHMSEQFIVGA